MTVIKRYSGQLVKTPKKDCRTLQIVIEKVSTKSKKKPLQINARVFKFYEISQSPKKAYFEMTNCY